MEIPILVFSFLVVALTFGYILYAKKQLLSIFKRSKIKMAVATDDEHMSLLAATNVIRDASKVFLKTEYRAIVPAAILVAIVFSLFIEKWSGLTFLLGATLSSLACINGMDTSTIDNGLTSHTADKTRSLGEATKQALLGGLLTGIPVQAFGTLGMIIMFTIASIVGVTKTSCGIVGSTECILAVQLTTACSLGYSLIALFNRVSGGMFTKAADVASDILGKNDLGFDEDDPRIPAVVADQTGDNVNDIAGNASDLCESYVATISSSFMSALNISYIAVAANAIATKSLTTRAIFYPLAIAVAGLLSCVLAAVVVMRSKIEDNPSKKLDLLTYISAGTTFIFSIIVTYLFFGNVAESYSDFHCDWYSPLIASACGILSGVVIGKITEYYTDTKYTPTIRVAKAATRGSAFEVSLGEAYAYKSVFVEMLILGIAIYVSLKACGQYGAAISSLGMLSFIGVTVSVDAFGPISDNAGGLAEICNLDKEVRDEITDRLDAVGNTTAAIGKGFAIGSAALASFSLLNSYVSQISPEMSINLMAPKVLAGVVVGIALIALVIAELTQNTIDSADKMVEKCKEQMQEISEQNIHPRNMGKYYNECVKLATEETTGFKMLKIVSIPLIGIVICIVLFGTEFAAGILAGYLFIGIMMAIFMANSGAIWDNAKKYIENGGIEGVAEHSLAHMIAVACDTIGDLRKDVIAVDMDIIMKLSLTFVIYILPFISNIKPIFG